MITLTITGDSVEEVLEATLKFSLSEKGKQVLLPTPTSVTPEPAKSVIQQKTDELAEKIENSKAEVAKRSHKKKEAPVKAAKAEEPEEEDEDDDEDEKPEVKSKKKAVVEEDEDEDEDEKPKKVVLDESPEKVTIETIRKAAGQLAKAGLDKVIDETLEYFDYEVITEIPKDEYGGFYKRLVKNYKKATA